MTINILGAFALSASIQLWFAWSALAKTGNPATSDRAALVAGGAILLATWGGAFGFGLAVDVLKGWLS